MGFVFLLESTIPHRKGFYRLDWINTNKKAPEFENKRIDNYPESINCKIVQSLHTNVPAFLYHNIKDQFDLRFTILKMDNTVYYRGDIREMQKIVYHTYSDTDNNPPRKKKPWYICLYRHCFHS